MRSFGLLLKLIYAIVHAFDGLTYLGLMNTLVQLFDFNL